MVVEGTPVAASTIKLDAVNEVLEGVGEFPVSALDTGESSSAGLAESFLDRQSRRIQSLGWHENTEKDTELEPNASDNIVIDADVIRFDTTGASAEVNVALRSGNVYDLDEDTDEFDGSMHFEIVRFLAFDDLSDHLRAYVIADAKLSYRSFRLGIDEQTNVLRAERNEEMFRARKQDAKAADYNILNTTSGQQVSGKSYSPVPTR